ncbi:MerC domain-containing protein [Alteromonas oceanisediminis]|uniref:MerC domain-containing protein n=1 Tax=Alteromonas oceanisediminis TaxID=2836180 RepID=UPI0028F3F87B|nr:MerC domain-containing protein [Alteromonas oceanisediminis]
MLQQNRILLDKLGIWVSGLCALHCLALPLLLPILPFVASSFVAEVWFERTILSLSILVGATALLIGFYRHHRQRYPLFALAAGAAIYWNKDIFGEAYEPITIALGAGLIIAAHLMNLRLCRTCRTCESETHHTQAVTSRI